MRKKHRKHEILEGFIAPASLDSANVVRALTHSSYCAEQKGDLACEDNQRLEFLGDAILQWLSSDYLFRNFPSLGEGWMTQRRSVLVSRDALYRLALTVGVPSALRLGRSEEKDGGRHRLSTISDAMEALVGAIYLEIGAENIRRWAERELHDFWARRIELANLANPKGKLQELLQEQGAGLPLYEVVSVSGPDHARKFEVRVVSQGSDLGRGWGSSKKEAEVEAARVALESFARSASKVP